MGLAKRIAAALTEGRITESDIQEAVAERLRNIEKAQQNGEKARKAIAARQEEIRQARNP